MNQREGSLDGNASMPIAWDNRHRLSTLDDPQRQTEYDTICDGIARVVAST